MYEVGVAKTDITAFKKDIGMMGYGMYFNTVEDVETPLYSRAFVFHHRQSGKKIAIVINEQCFITLAIRKEVLHRLHTDHPEVGLSEQNLMLTSQHTHSGPGGYSHYGLYNISIPGFVPEVFDAIVSGTVQAIVEAHENLAPAKLSFNKGQFSEDIPVGFNRSMKAFLSNPEAEGVDPKDTHLAIDRTMRLLRIDGENGERIGAINWFGVHTTSVHNDNHRVCSDNKGYAADFMELHVRETHQDQKFISAFGQGTAGDVTPNYVWDKKKKWTRGAHEDDFESARHNGRLQFDLAQEIYDKAPNVHRIEGDIDFAVRNFNFSVVSCDPDFTGGVKGMHTAPACHGVSFFAGTVEGPGMPGPVAFLSRGLSRFIKYYELATNVFRKPIRRVRIRNKYIAHKPKDILFEAGERKVLGSYDIKNLIVPGFSDKNIRYLKKLHPKGLREDNPWVPHVLPLQITCLGDIVFVGIPAETTTIAGRRLRELVETEMEALGCHEVVILPYANGYCGYITTNEEYQHQMYEGGHTVYGQWTLAAFQTKLRKLIRDMISESAPRQIAHEDMPPIFSPEELKRRSYAENF